MGFSIGQCCNVDSYQRRNLLMAGKCKRDRNESDGCGREVNLIEREEKNATGVNLMAYWPTLKLNCIGIAINVFPVRIFLLPILDRSSTRCSVAFKPITRFIYFLTIN